MLDVILIIIGALCMIAGLAGCILPFLPGPPIAYLGLFILHCTDKVYYRSWIILLQCWAVNTAVAVSGEIGDV